MPGVVNQFTHHGIPLPLPPMLCFWLVRGGQKALIKKLTAIVNTFHYNLRIHYSTSIMSALITIPVPLAFHPVCLMMPGTPATIHITSTFTHEDLRFWCRMWGNHIGRTLIARRDANTIDLYTVSDCTDAPRITRAHYPYTTLAVGTVFRIPMEAEPSLQNLRTWTSQQGKRLHRKFSITTQDNEYVITRKA